MPSDLLAQQRQIFPYLHIVENKWSTLSVITGFHSVREVRHINEGRNQLILVFWVVV